LLTKLIHPPNSSSHINTLLSPSGDELYDNAAIAARLNDHYAAISALSQQDPSVQQQVLAALQAAIQEGSVHVFPQARAAAAGSAEVSADEVLAAMRGLPPSSSPGPDGIPYAYL
jgi:hypothetical protein